MIKNYKVQIDSVILMINNNNNQCLEVYKDLIPLIKRVSHLETLEIFNMMIIIHKKCKEAFMLRKKMMTLHNIENNIIH
jgi:hypothetical protein